MPERRQLGNRPTTTAPPSPHRASPPLVRSLGLQEYEATAQAMRRFTRARDAATRDEIWRLEHFPVFTQGATARPEHILKESSTIPILETDRGGKITYHGPGQIVVYLLFDLRRRKLSPRALVSLMEETVIALLRGYSVEARARPDAPGVYVNDAKIASLGVRISQGCSYHGLALNVNMDLEPFSWIQPCGLGQTPVTQLCRFVPEAKAQEVAPVLVDLLLAAADRT